MHKHPPPMQEPEDQPRARARKFRGIAKALHCSCGKRCRHGQLRFSVADECENGNVEIALDLCRTVRGKRHNSQAIALDKECGRASRLRRAIESMLLESLSLQSRDTLRTCALQLGHDRTAQHNNTRNNDLTSVVSSGRSCDWREDVASCWSVSEAVSRTGKAASFGPVAVALRRAQWSHACLAYEF